MASEDQSVTNFESYMDAIGSQNNFSWTNNLCLELISFSFFLFSPKEQKIDVKKSKYKKVGFLLFSRDFPFLFSPISLDFGFGVRKLLPKRFVG